MTNENIKQAIKIVKQYKLELKEIVSYIKQKYNLKTFLNEYFKDDKITNELVRLNAIISFNFKANKIKLVSLLDNNIRISIKLARG